MRVHDVSANGWVPDACTLPTVQLPLRLAEFDQLFADSVRGLDRLGPEHLRMYLDSAEQVEATVRDLTARETQCCSFFTFTIERPEPDSLTLDVRVPTAHIPVLDALADRATAGRTRP
jgi:hypothetical protein